jgi:hypothetical protein
MPVPFYKKRSVIFAGGIGLFVLSVWISIYFYNNWSTNLRGSYCGYTYTGKIRKIPLDTVNTVAINDDQVEVKGTKITLKDWIREWNPDPAIFRFKRWENNSPLSNANKQWELRDGGQINQNEGVIIFQNIKSGHRIRITLPGALIGTWQIYQANEDLTLFAFAGGCWKGGPDPGCRAAIIAISRQPNPSFNPDATSTGELLHPSR